MPYFIDPHTYKSPNYDNRPSGTVVDAIVIHTTEGRWPSDAEWLCNPDAGVSCHYVIPPTGVIIYRLVPDGRRAWHAGTSSYAGRSNWNNFSIGVEVSHMQGDAWPAGQHDMLASLCRKLIDAYPIAEVNIAAHRWVAPDRKIDPTDWNDSDFKAWIASLYTPTIVRYVVTSPCAILTARAGDAPPAAGPDNGQTWLDVGDIVNGESQPENGWLWISDDEFNPPGIGFVPASYAERL